MGGISMRAINKTFIQFSLLTIPINIFKATKSTGIGFKQIHKGCGGLVRQPKRCERCDEFVEKINIAKGWEHTKGEYLVVNPEEVMENTTITSIPIIQFTTLDQIDPRFMKGDVYYVSSQEGGEEMFGLLVGVLSETKKVAICKYVIQSKERIGVMYPLENNTLCLFGMRYTDEVRESFVLESYWDKDSDEFKLAEKVINQHTKNFDPKDFEDEQSLRIKLYLEAKKDDKVVPTFTKSILQKTVSIKEQLRKALKSKKTIYKR